MTLPIIPGFLRKRFQGIPRHQTITSRLPPNTPNLRQTIQVYKIRVTLVRRTGVHLRRPSVMNHPRIYILLFPLTRFRSPLVSHVRVTQRPLIVGVTRKIQARPVVMGIFIRGPRKVHPLRRIRIPSRIFTLLRTLVGVRVFLFRGISPRRFSPTNSRVVQRNTIVFVRRARLRHIRRFPPTNTVNSRTGQTKLQRQLSFQVQRVTRNSRIRHVTHSHRSQFRRVKLPRVVQVRASSPLPTYYPRTHIPHHERAPILLVSCPSTQIFLYVFFTSRQTTIQQAVIRGGSFSVLVQLFRGTIRANLGVNFRLMSQGSSTSRQRLYALYFRPRFLRDFSTLVLAYNLPYFGGFRGDPLGQSQGGIPSLSKPRPPQTS